MKEKDPTAPYLPLDWEKAFLAETVAIQALQRGDADADQQKRALRFIVEALCGTYDLSYRPNSQRDTDFAEGKRFVGTQLVKLTKINLAAVRAAKLKET